MPNYKKQDSLTLKKADWEVDFYSRPIIDSKGKKRWELLITTSQDISDNKPFRWEKICPAGEVNSIWLSNALQEAIIEAKQEGWEKPLRIRAWRSSMKTMVKKAAIKVGLDVIASRRTYSLIEWLKEREEEIYPLQEGYMNGPLAPPAPRILNDPIPLPEAVRGDAWSFTSLPIGALREAKDWPMEFSGLLPIKEIDDETIEVPGLRLFSELRSLPIAGWLGGLEPVKLTTEGNQLLLEAGQEDRWLVTDMSQDIAESARQIIINSREKCNGYQFIAVQKNPADKKFSGFWMLRDIAD